MTPSVGALVSSAALAAGLLLLRRQVNLGHAWTYETPRDPRRRRCFREASREARPRTFKVKRDASKELLEANPKLRALIESDCGHDCTAYSAWVNHGRRGQKPRARAGDGRFAVLELRCCYPLYNP